MTSYNIILTGIATLLAIYCLYLRWTIARLKPGMQPVSEHRLMVSNNNSTRIIKTAQLLFAKEIVEKSKTPLTFSITTIH